MQQLAVPNQRKIFSEDTTLWIECMFAIRTTTSVDALQKLSNRLLIIDGFLHFARSEVQLIGKLWKLAFDKIFS